MSTKPHCSLSFIISQQSPVAVIARRGPSNRACLIRWDIRRSSFDIGHWYKGRVELSDLSPDGEWLLSVCSKGYDVWTVLSKPPYLTAHGLWHIGDHWGGGGRFLSNGSLALHRVGSTHGLENVGPFRLPSSMKVRLWGAEDDNRPAELDRWHRAFGAKDSQKHEIRADFAHGWTVTGPNGLRLESNQLRERRLVDKDGHILAALPTAIQAIAFNPWGERTGIVFSRAGKLFALPEKHIRSFPDDDALMAEAVELTDFTDLTFETKVAPDWALPSPRLAQPAEGEPWHPLRGTSGRRPRPLRTNGKALR
jgi:hypothetical protein